MFLGLKHIMNSKSTKNNLVIVLSIKVILLLLLSLFLVAADLKAQAIPAIYNIEALNSIRDNKNDERLTVFIEEANNIVLLQPLSVFDKKSHLGPTSTFIVVFHIMLGRMLITLMVHMLLKMVRTIQNMLSMTVKYSTSLHID